MIDDRDEHEQRCTHLEENVQELEHQLKELREKHQDLVVR